MNKQRHKDEVEARIDADLQDATTHVLVRENEGHSWNVRCYCLQNYVGGVSNVSPFSKAMELAEFYAPCKDAIRVEVGVAM